ncbi:hypothetical protein MRB53_003280 [Persea americana]|uniref:Uncharacterized protein n=1 Tax=Persea americana TaxID=3435 RepID=A0ACC2MWV5_PERAE|nr:hypothetical protein MRB53_003280 [Persea americana]
MGRNPTALVESQPSLSAAFSLSACACALLLSTMLPFSRSYTRLLTVHQKKGTAERGGAVDGAGRAGDGRERRCSKWGWSGRGWSREEVQQMGLVGQAITERGGAVDGAGRRSLEVRNRERERGDDGRSEGEGDDG